MCSPTIDTTYVVEHKHHCNCSSNEYTIQLTLRKNYKFRNIRIDPTNLKIMLNLLILTTLLCISVRTCNAEITSIYENDTSNPNISNSKVGSSDKNLPISTIISSNSTNNNTKSSQYNNIQSNLKSDQSSIQKDASDIKIASMRTGAGGGDSSSAATGHKKVVSTPSYQLPATMCLDIRHPIDVFNHSHLLGGRHPGKQSLLGSSSSIEDCTKKCCLSPSCHVVLFYTTMKSCVAVTCDTAQPCQPVPYDRVTQAKHYVLVDVRHAFKPDYDGSQLRSQSSTSLNAEPQTSNLLASMPITTTRPTASTQISNNDQKDSIVNLSSKSLTDSGASSFLANPAESLNESVYNIQANPTDSVDSTSNLPASSAGVLNDSTFKLEDCEVGLQSCPRGEICVGFGAPRRDGICNCKQKLVRNSQTGACEAVPEPTESTVTTSMPQKSPDKSTTTTTTTTAAATTTTTSKVVGKNDTRSTVIVPTPITPKSLVLTVNNKTVTLSEGSSTYQQKVTLSAYVFEGCKTCQYDWKVLHQPATSGETTGSVTEPHSPTITEPHSPTITLAGLVAGTYLFSVTAVKPAHDGNGATGATASAVGSTVATVTVLKHSQRNKPPVVSIVPIKQSVTLPNAAVILDGSGSTDDSTESSKLEYKWEIVTSTLGYTLGKQTGQTLKLQNLLPGNYTIMLRVKDAIGLEANTTAIVEVVQEKDYPPSANAGGDQVVYLPQTETVLNGSASSDDHGIVEWEWTKGPKDDGLAVDMQDTRKPLLKLSGLEVGHYQFVLRVVDNSGQSDASVANVYVHTPGATPIEANAGLDIVLTLPEVTTVLDGTKSTGVTPETKCVWTQVSGPNTAHFTPSAEQLLVNVTGLTKGVYVFQLQLSSKDRTKTAKDETYVTVRQEKNEQPKANGGGDFSVTLPVSLVQVNGSASTDDVGIVRWRWERLPTSLAAGHVLGQSGSSPVLLLTGLVTGQYQWRLTVWDDQGASSSDTVSFYAKPGPHHRDEVAIVLGAGIESVSAAQLTSLLQAMKLLIPPTITLHMMDYSGLPFTGESSVVVLGHDSSNADMGSSTKSPGSGKTQNKPSILSGVKLAAMLQSGVRTATAGSGHLFDLPVTVIQTVICQNNCSGHGACDQVRRECVCHSWWMESFTRRHFGDTTPNCDWSVVYVFVSCIAATTMTVVCLWAVLSFAVRRTRKSRSKRRTVDGSRSKTVCDNVLGCCSKEGGVGGGVAGHRRRAVNGNRYTLLEDDIIKMRARNSLLDSCSDSGSDTEVVFDSRLNTKRHKLQDKHKNGYTKLMGPKLRT